MNAESDIKIELIEALGLLTLDSDYSKVQDVLFNYNYEDYNKIFELDKVVVQPETYQRIPVYKGEKSVAILMVWGKDNVTAIHDHSNFDGRIKVLKGTLSEVNYRENFNFIEYNGVKTAFAGQVLPEEIGGIHSIINQSDDFSVSVHVYGTSQLNLDGVRIFDTKSRRVAWLNEYANSCSWQLPENAYSRIISI